MKTIKNYIVSQAEKVDVADARSVTACAESIVEAISDFKFTPGSSVAVLEDPTYPYAGQRGKVVGKSAKGSGFVDVEFANKTVVPLQASILLPV